MFVFNAREHTGLDPHIQRTFMGGAYGSQTHPATPVLNVAPQRRQGSTHRQRVIDNQVILTRLNPTDKGGVEHQTMIRPAARTKRPRALNNLCFDIQPQSGSDSRCQRQWDLITPTRLFSENWNDSG